MFGILIINLIVVESHPPGKQSFSIQWTGDFQGWVYVIALAGLGS